MRVCKDFNSVGNATILIYNCAVTSGASYDGHNFDMGLHFG